MNELEKYTKLTEQRVILEKRSYVIINTLLGLNSIPRDIYYNHYRYIYDVLVEILVYC